MEKKLLLAFVLSIAVLLAFHYYTARTVPQPGPVQEETFTQASPRPIAVSPAQGERPEIVLAAGESRVETGLFEVAINLNGGGLAGFTLKEYTDKDGDLINLVRPERQASNLPLNSYWPGSPVLIFQGEKALSLTEGRPRGDLLLRARGENWEVSRRLSFDNQQYLLWLELSWENLSSQRRQLPDYYLVCTPGFGSRDKENRQYAEVRSGIFQGDRIKTNRWKINSLVRQLIKTSRETNVVSRLDKEIPGAVKWMAYRIKYFTVIVKPEGEAKGILFSGLGEDDVLCRLKMPGSGLEPGEKFSQRFAVYLGPVDYHQLQGLNLGFETIFDSGGLAPLRRLVMIVLRFFYRLIGNWGVAIILLTIVAKIILLPLTQKSFRSMREMQKLQPQITSLRQVYKDSPQKLQKEIMELYRRHKVNPMGGCFPMLLQMPVFIALFTALRSAIELRQAPFIFWIQDLAAKDPFYVLPILMGGTMFLQQKMTPQADPQQARLGMIMPIFFTFIFMNFPSGLVLYWLVNSVLSLGEQWRIRKEK